MKFLYTISLICFSFAAFCADTVRIYDIENLVVSVTSGTSFDLNVEIPSGDSTTDSSESTTARIYVPMKNASADHNKYLYYSRSGATTLSSSVAGTSTINFPLSLTLGTTDKYLYSAVKINSKYYAASRTSSTFRELNNFQYVYSLTPYTFCNTFTISGTGVSNPCSDTSTFASTLTVYFFLSAKSDYALGAEVSPATETGGVYFSVKMSNRIYDSSELTLSISNVRKGDKRILADFSSSTTMANFSKVKAFIHSAAPGSDNRPIGDTVNYPGGSIFSDDIATNQSGGATINQLTNGQTYFVSLFFVDKYLFTSVLSPDFSETPTQIEELLKKQACYLLTAGFGEEHYIINYFRSFRDRVLAHNWFGQKFIHFYYRTAPSAALYIYQHQTVRLIIRSLAYLTYFVFNYFYLILLLLALAFFPKILAKFKTIN